MPTFTKSKISMDAAIQFCATAMMLLCLTQGAALGVEAQPQPFGAAGSKKIRVTDPTVLKDLKAKGGRVVADYGTFSVMEIDAASVPNLPEVETLQEGHKILLNSGAIDTSTQAAKAMRAVVKAGAFTGKRLHLLQFAGPVKPEWLTALTDTGVEIVTAIPTSAYLVYGSAAQLTALQTLAGKEVFIQWDGTYQDTHKLHPRVAARIQNAPALGGNSSYSIQLYEDAAANADTLKLIGQLQTNTLRQDRAIHYVNVTVELPDAAVSQIAQQPDVVSIHPFVEPKKNDERQDMIISGNISGNGPTLGTGYLAWLASKGFTQAQFTASNFAVDITDSGIDNATTTPNHFGLHIGGTLAGASRIIYNRLEGTANSGSVLTGTDGHGNLNSHIIGGFVDKSGAPHQDASNYHYGLGVAPFVKMGSSVIFDPNSYTSPSFPNLQSRAYNNGVRISSNSWGAATAGSYTTDSQSYDALVRDAQPTGSTFATAGNQEMVIVFAAGNSGSGASTVGSPSTGKNIICVGASENVQAFGGSDGSGIADSGADNLNDIVYFSGRGPCTDGRIKPDLVAPGTHVSGGVWQQNAVETGTGAAGTTFNGTGVSGGVGAHTSAQEAGDFFPASQQFYTASSGTSHSCPCVAGACALVRQYFINQGLTPPSPAMTKAFLLNSTRYITGVSANDSLYSNNQGMGLMDLSASFDGITRIQRDEISADIFTASGQSRTITGIITDATKPFRVTLAWTDAPGPTSGNAYLNDLDLKVVIGGNTYKGNNFVGATSVAGGTADSRNNVESVFLPAGIAAGTPFSVVVTSSNIVADGVPNFGTALDQDYALVVYNGAAANVNVAGLSLVSATVSAAGGNLNSQIDPNECNLLDISIRNDGTTAVTGISTTLTSNTPNVSITRPFSTYPNLNAGASGTNATQFRISTNSSFVSGTTISLTLYVNSTGNSTISVPISLATTISVGTAVRFNNNTALNLVDDGTVDSSMVVSGISGNVAKVTVSFYCTHTYDSDMTFTLISPDNTSVILLSGLGGASANFGSAATPDSSRLTLDDSAATSITAGTAPFVGTFRPQASLSAFNLKSGTAINGTWKLRCFDSFAQDTGVLTAWSLFISPAVVNNGPGVCTSPTTVADSFTLFTNSPFSPLTSVLSNDTTDGPTLTAALASPPSHGSVTLNSNGTFTFTPTSGYVGADSFTYFATGTGSAVGTVNLTIVAANTAPTITGTVASQAVNDNATRSPFAAVTIGDTDTPAQTQSVTVSPDTVAKGSFTSASLTASGFVNQGGSNLNYTFSGTATAATTAIRLLVFAPTPNRVLPGATETTVLTISSNDGNVTTTNNVSTVVSTSINDAPSITGTIAGQKVFDNATIAPFAAVSVVDPDSAQTLNITVTLDVAAKGSFIALSGFANGGNGSYTFSGTAAAATTAIRGLLFSPTANRVAPPATETTTFTILVNDTIALAVSNNTTTVITTPVNDATTITGALANQALLDTSTLAPFTAILVSDIDTAQALSASVQLDVAAKGSFTTLNGFTDAGNGLYTFSGTAAEITTALRGLVFTPTANRVSPPSTETTTLTITVRDDAGGSASNNITTVVVSPVNDAPTITGAIANQAVLDTATIAPFAAVSINDLDSAQTLNVSVSLDVAAKGSFTTLSGFTNGGNGAYTFSGTAAAATTAIRGLVFAPTTNRVAPPATETTTFTISANDTVAPAVSNNTTTVVTTPVNDATTITGALANQALLDTNTLTPFTTILVSDADTAQVLRLSVQLDLAAKGSFTTLNGFTEAGNGLYTFNGTAATATTALRGLVFTPKANRVSPPSTETTTLTITIRDDAGGTASNNLTTVVVSPVNDAPSTVQLALTSAIIDENGSTTLKGTFVDPDVQDPHSVTITWGDGTPDTALTLAAGELSFSAPHTYLDNPADAPSGSFTIKASVTDVATATSSSTTTIQVKNVAPSVVILGAPTAGDAGVSIPLTSTVNDPGTLDKPTLAWNVTKNGAPFGSGTLPAFAFVPDTQGTYLVTLTVTDKDGASASASASIAVDAKPAFLSGPTATPNPGEVDLAVVFSATTNPADALVTWDFGDGSPPQSGNSVSHIYTVSDNFKVTATAKNIVSGRTSSVDFILPIVRAKSVVGTLLVSELHGVIQFSSKADQATVSGIIPLSSGQKPSGLKIDLALNGLTRTCTFDAKGKASFKDGTASLSVKTKDGVTTGKLGVKLKGTLKPELSQGASLDSEGQPKKLLISLTYNGALSTNIVPLVFKKGKAQY